MTNKMIFISFQVARKTEPQLAGITHTTVDRSKFRTEPLGPRWKSPAQILHGNYNVSHMAVSDANTFTTLLLWNGPLPFFLASLDYKSHDESLRAGWMIRPSIDYSTELALDWRSVVECNPR